MKHKNNSYDLLQYRLAYNELSKGITFIRVTAGYFYPDRGCLVDILQSWVEKLQEWPRV